MTEEKKNIKKDTAEKSEEAKFKGKYVQATGRRKTSVARVRLYKNGKGTIVVNDMSLKKYFSTADVMVVSQPLKLTGHLRDLDFSVLVKGGGKKGQAEAIRHGVSRALILMDPELKTTLKSKDFLTRDARKKERKKPGLKKARRAPQWSKR